MKYKTRTFIFLFVSGVFLIFFLSWKNDPNLSGMAIIPDWLGSWADHYRNTRKRTAVPMMGLGLLTGLYLMQFRIRSLKSWIAAWGFLVLIVAIAEAGQYFITSRYSDYKDMFWGGCGAATGMLITFLAYQLKRLYGIINVRNRHE